MAIGGSKRRIAILITGDARTFTAAMDAVDAAMQKTNRVALSVEKRMKKVGEGLTLGVTVPLAAAGGAAIGAAADFTEALNKSNVVFEDSAEIVSDFAETAGEKLGIAGDEALDQAANFGTFFQTFGIGRKESARLSVEMVKLAGDLGSFNNVDPTEMLQRLRAGLAGEIEPLRRFGVNLSDAAVKLKAVELGLAATTAEVTQNQKVQARLALITEQTANAQGDFARTSGELVNQVRILKAEVRNMAADFGEALVPAAKEVVSEINGVVTAFKSLPEGMQGAIAKTGAFAAALGPLLLVAGKLGIALRTLGVAASGMQAALVSGGLLAAVGLAVKVFGDWGESVAASNKQLEDYKDLFDELDPVVRAQGENLGELRKALELESRERGSSKDKVDDHTFALVENTTALNSNAKAFFADKLKDQREAVEASGLAFSDLTGAVTGNEDAYKRFTDALERTRDVSDKYYQETLQLISGQITERTVTEEANAANSRKQAALFKLVQLIDAERAALGEANAAKQLDIARTLVQENGYRDLEIQLNKTNAEFIIAAANARLAAGEVQALNVLINARMLSKAFENRGNIDSAAAALRNVGLEAEALRIEARHASEELKSAGSAGAGAGRRVRDSLQEAKKEAEELGDAFEDAMDEAADAVDLSVSRMVGAFDALDRKKRASAELDEAIAEENRIRALAEGDLELAIQKARERRRAILERDKATTADEEKDVVEARLAVARAEDELDAARGDSSLSADEVRLAELNLIEATNALADATAATTERSKEFQDALALEQDLIHQRWTLTEDLEAAEREREKATLDLIVAEEGLLEASGDIVGQRPEVQEMFLSLAKSAGIEADSVLTLIATLEALEKARRGQFGGALDIQASTRIRDQFGAIAQTANVDVGTLDPGDIGAVAASSPQAAQAISNITINLPPGADGDDVVRALIQWQRQNGPVPVTTVA